MMSEYVRFYLAHLLFSDIECAGDLIDPLVFSIIFDVV